MAEREDPWRRGPTAPRRPPQIVIWLGLVALIGLTIWGLTALFPEVRLDDDRKYDILYCAVVLVALAGSLSARRINLPEAARNVALWVAVVAVLAVAYVASGPLSGLGTRLRTELMPREPVAADPQTLVLTADDSGDFAVTGRVNGTRVLFAVDTGASDIVLSPDDARRLGIDIASLRYIGKSETANGTGHFAAAHIDSLTIGTAQFFDLDVSVNQAPMDRSLLGMAFLRRLKGFAIEGDRLTMRLK